MKLHVMLNRKDEITYAQKVFFEKHDFMMQHSEGLNILQKM